MRMRVAGLRQPHLIRTPFLQGSRNVLLGLGFARVQNLRLDVQPPLVIYVEALVENGAVGLKDPGLLVGQDLQARLLLRVVEEVSVDMSLEHAEVFFDIFVLGVVGAGVSDLARFRLAIGEPLLAPASQPLPTSSSSTATLT